MDWKYSRWVWKFSSQLQKEKKIKNKQDNKTNKPSQHKAIGVEGGVDQTRGVTVGFD